MADLHWLRVNECIIFKVAGLMYKCATSTPPQYLSDLVMKTHHRPLRSSSNGLLPISKCNTYTSWETPLFLQWDQGYVMNSLRA